MKFLEVLRLFFKKAPPQKKRVPNGFVLGLDHPWASLVAQLVKTPPGRQETPVPFLGQKDPLEKG